VAWLLAYSIAGIGRFYNRLQVFERWMRRIVGWLFTGTGLYYLIRLL
jgi:threonine/homoserine/homoserine lactone efflux protein